MAALQNLKAASDLVKALRGAEVGFEKAQLKLQVAELAELLANARMSVLDAQEEIHRLQKRIRELEASEDVRERLVRRGNVYFLKDGDKEKGPYCLRCYESDQKLMPLRTNPPGMRDFGLFVCPHCQDFY